MSDHVLALGALAVALAAIGRLLKGVWNKSREVKAGLDHVRKTYALMEQVAPQLRPNGGNSIYDKVTTIVGEQVVIKQSLEEAREMAATAAQDAAAAAVEAGKAYQKADEMQVYLHRFRHDAIGGISNSKLGVELLTKMFGRLDDEKQKILDELTETFPEPPDNPNIGGEGR